MRPARLGLGAKPLKGVNGGGIAGDSVSRNLALKTVLTKNKNTCGKVEKETGKAKMQRNQKLEAEEEEGGRASMISNKKRKPF